MDHTYSAFISYRHLPKDTAAALQVQRALENYRIPREIRKKTGLKKLKRCFRDQDELPLAEDLGSSIEKALRESEWLIVICSPDLPASRWCCRETEYFIGLGRKDRIIPVLIRGEPGDSYPPLLTADSQGRETEPLAADLRGKTKKLLRTEKLRIIARMLGLNYNDLKKREKERALRKGLVCVSAVLTVVTGFAGYAIWQNRLLTRERNATARNASELLLERSLRSTQDGELGNGLTYALQAYSSSRIFGAEYDDAVSAALEAAMYPEAFSQFGTLKDHGLLHRRANLSNDGSLVACRQSDDSLRVYSSLSGEQLFVIRGFGWYGKNAPDFSPDSQYICRVSDDSVTLYDAKDGSIAASAPLPDGWTALTGGLTLQNELPLVHRESGRSAFFDPFDRKLTELAGAAPLKNGELRAELHRSGKLGIWWDGERIWLVDTNARQVLLEVKGTVPESSGAFTDDGLYIRYLSESGYIYLQWDSLKEVCRTKLMGALTPDGSTLACPNGMEGFTVYSAKTGELLWTGGHNSGNTLYSVAFLDDDTLIASHGEIQIYSLRDQRTVYDSGSDRTAYGYDFAAGRMVMPLRAGGCLMNLLPQENSPLPHSSIIRKEDCSEADLSGTTTLCLLSGNWQGSTYASLTENGAADQAQDGLMYTWNGKDYFLHPSNGVQAPFVYVSPDGKWQALIRGQEVDIFRAEQGPEVVLTIPGNGYDRLCAAICGDTLALGAYVENLAFYDLLTGEMLGSADTGAMCTGIQFSPDGRHVIALSAMAEQAAVVSTENLAVIMKIPVTDIYLYAQMHVGFSADGTEAMVLYPDGHADAGLLYTSMDTLVRKAREVLSDGPS